MDFQILVEDVNNRLNPGKSGVSREKKNKLVQRDYDYTEKMVVASQPLKPLTPPPNIPSKEQGETENNNGIREQDPVQFPKSSQLILEELLASDDDFIIEHRCSDRANLPPFTEVATVPNTNYNNITPEEFVSSINKVYEEMMSWKKNLFLLPSGIAGRNFIKLLSEWLGNYNNTTTFQGIALKVVSVLPNLLLQKPTPKSKTKDNSSSYPLRWRAYVRKPESRDFRSLESELPS